MKDKDIYLQIPTPCYVIEEEKLIRNLEILKKLQEETGVRILLAQKAFSMFSLYPLIGKYLSGTTASGLFEAKLGYEEMGKENHIFSTAYPEQEFDEIVSLCDHIIFNSHTQWARFKDRALARGRECGIRINPMKSTQNKAIYDPCAAGSRLGIPLEQYQEKEWNGISGLHFHTLCEQNADALAVTLAAVEEQFGSFLSNMKWINFGGGHHITRPDYDLEQLKACIFRMQDKYHLTVYLEPGEAVVLNTGFLAASVLDILDNGMQNAILDTSAACHMPDVLEMPYRPEVINAGKWGEKPYAYRLGGPTCLAGDIIGDYAFDKPLKIGDRLLFCDMAHYTMVKNNTFNGMKLPSIAVLKGNKEIEIIRNFSYKDFKDRLS